MESECPSVYLILFIFSIETLFIIVVYVNKNLYKSYKNRRKQKNMSQVESSEILKLGSLINRENTQQYVYSAYFSTPIFASTFVWNNN